MSLFLCISVLPDLALTALHKALCLLLCKKLEISLNAKPTKPEIIALKFLFYFFQPLGNLGNIKSTWFFSIGYMVLLWALICIL